MALASAGKVPARGRKFVIFGLFFMVFLPRFGKGPNKNNGQRALVIAPAVGGFCTSQHQLSTMICTSW